MPQTYLFYDLETTGLNKCFDQVMQFAAIRTDENLIELERHEYFVKINPDVIPSPEAMITHGLDLNLCSNGLPEIEAMEKIHALMNTPGTISLGYNTLGFDDEFLRFSFYRNLFPPYTHQYVNHCGRMDLYPIVILYYLYCKEALNWPSRNGNISLKLEDLNHENQLAPGLAHNALVDVQATIALAKKLRNQEKMWNYSVGYFNKKIDTERCLHLPAAFSDYDHNIKEGLIILGRLGAKLNFQAPVISLGQHQHYRNQTLWLRLDFENFAEITTDNIEENNYVFRKRCGEDPFLLPPKPDYLQQIGSERLKLAHENKQWLAHNPQKLQRIAQYHQSYKYPEVLHCDLDAMLYQRGFPTPHDEQQMQKFHAAPLSEKLNIAKQFSDVLYREQALRIIARNYPKLLDDESYQELVPYFAQLEQPNAIVDYRNQSHPTKAQTLAKIAELTAKIIDPTHLKLLADLKIFLERRKS